MPYGADSPLIGSTIDPRLFVQDYSGFANAAAIQSAGMLSAANQITSGFADYQKQQKDQKAALKASAAEIDAAATLFPEMKGTLEGFKAQITNEELPISERAAIASRISGVINMGVDQMRNQQEFGLRQQQANLQAQESGMRQLALGQELQAAESKNAAIEANVPLLMEMLQKQNEQTKAISPETMSKISGMTDKRAQADAITSAIKLTAPEGTEYSDVKDFKIGDQIVQGRMNFRTGEIQPATFVQTFALPNQSGYSVDENGVVTQETQAAVQSNAKKFMIGDVDISKVPLGMRNNNPTNIVYPSAAYAKKVGAIGASTNEDAGSSKPGGGKYKQLVFADPVTGMTAGANLARQKYEGGMKTANSLIAGNDGWTPGNSEAATNIAKSMGIGPDDDLKLNTPQGMESFLKSLAMQEHGNASKLYNPAVYKQAVGNAFGFNQPQPAISSATSGQVSPELQYRMQQDAKSEQQAQVATAQTVSSDVAKSKEMLNTLEKLEKSSGFSNLFGTNLGIPTWVPGSAGADAKAIFEQLQAQGFLESVKSMKGMGALSDAEGAKLDKAYLGLSPGMKEETAKARIAELKQIIQKGIDRIQSGNLLASPGQTQSDPFQSATQRLLSLPKQ